MGGLGTAMTAHSGENEGPIRFRTKILKSGKTAAGIQVPAGVLERLGSSKRPPVRVTIHGHTYRSTVAVMGGVFMVGVSAENRASAGVAAGDEVDVDIEVDTGPREVTVPRDFMDALGRDTDARRFFDGLSYSNKLRHVLAIDGAKTAETRQRRIAKALSLLREGRS
jgi:hypothetical protein